MPQHVPIGEGAFIAGGRHPESPSPGNIPSEFYERHRMGSTAASDRIYDISPGLLRVCRVGFPHPLTYESDYKRRQLLAVMRGQSSNSQRTRTLATYKIC